MLSRLFSQATRGYLIREAKHTAAAVALVVAISVVSDLSNVTDFETVAWAGIATNGFRAGATALLTALTRWRNYLKQPTDAGI